MSGFKVGDRVKVAENAQDYDGDASTLIRGHVGTVTDGPDGDGDICVQPDGRDYTEYVQPEFCTLVEPAEPETTWPRRVLAWGSLGESGTFLEFEDGRLSSPGQNIDVRKYGWRIDPRVTLPQEPPEPVREPGLWLARSGGSPRVMRWTGEQWEYPDLRGGSGRDWRPIARLTDDQVAAIEAAS